MFGRLLGFAVLFLIGRAALHKPDCEADSGTAGESAQGTGGSGGQSAGRTNAPTAASATTPPPAAKTSGSKPAKASGSKPVKTSGSKPAKASGSKPAKKSESKPAKKSESKPAKKSGAKASSDLTVVEGIGPKIKEVLGKGGIQSVEDLAKASADDLRTILANAGSRYRQHDPTTWPQQADLAARGKMDELAALQKELKGGR